MLTFCERRKDITTYTTSTVSGTQSVSAASTFIFHITEISVHKYDF